MKNYTYLDIIIKNKNYINYKNRYIQISKSFSIFYFT